MLRCWKVDTDAAVAAVILFSSRLAQLVGLCLYPKRASEQAVVTGRPGVLPSSPRHVPQPLTVRAKFVAQSLAFSMLVDSHRLELGSGGDGKNVRGDLSMV